MAMSNAERQRKYRLNRNANQNSRDKYLEAERQRYQRDKKRGTKASTKLLPEKEQRLLRRKWRVKKREQRKAKKTLDGFITPPMSPEDPVRGPEPEHPQGPSNNEAAPAPELSRQKRQSRRQFRRETAQCYRKNKALQLQLSRAEKRAEMYRKRWLRDQSKTSKLEDTPRKATKKLISNISSKTARRTLLFQTSLVHQLQTWYKSSKYKATIAKMVASGSILKKYKFISHTKLSLGVKVRKSSAKHTYLSLRECHRIQAYFERDDNSRIMTGKKQTVTHKKVKKQRRILRDTLRNIYLRYISEHKIKIGFSTFCRLRPFWVVFPKPSDRDTCLCKLCENTKLIATALQKAGAIKTDELKQLVGDLVCTQESENCMYGCCSKCSDKRLSYESKIGNEEIQWHQWGSKTEKRMIKAQNTVTEKEVVVTSKELRCGTVCQLVDQLEKDLERYKKHTFNVKHQFMFFKACKESIKENEVILHIDFSENYVCKLGNEIQSMHFGASKKQLSLHTGVYYMQGEDHPQTFCTVSENLDHGPGAIWVHLKPILKRIREANQNIDTLYIFSDGPCTQYRQKGNFYLLSQKPTQFGFKHLVWNFFEAGHGKGTPDAVGGAIKRHADTKVKYGQDITSSSSFVKATKESDILVLLVPDSDIANAVHDLSQLNLKPIKGTMKLHQVIWNGTPSEIVYRNLSCNCKTPNECPNHKLRQGNFHDMKAKEPTDDKAKLPETPEKEKKDCFEIYLDELNKCKTFDQLKQKCEEIGELLDVLNINDAANPVQIETDENSLHYVPDDLDEMREIYPGRVMADGNCLPSVGSVFAFGIPERTSEMRVRILCELALHESSYLDKGFLQMGRAPENSRNWPYIYSQYSDMYTPGTHLTDNIVREIFRNETLKIRKKNAYMGIWQIHAMASVLKTPVYSVYPKLGPSCVRQDLQRLVMPRELETTHLMPLHVLWTTTRRDMTNEAWVPNHFVPLLSREKMDSDTECVLLNEESFQSNLSSDQTKPNTDLSNGSGYTCLAQHVIVQYEGKPYPGFVEDATENEVFVECMHYVGRGGNNRFFWPKKIKDKCWYELENVLSIIPKPTPIDNSNHFSIDPSKWDIMQAQ